MKASDPSSLMPHLVSIDWLKANWADPDLLIFDATQAKAGTGEMPPNDLQIMGARHINLKGDFTQAESGLPNTIPEAAQIEVACRRLGIRRSSKVVVYDRHGIYSSPRFWWILRSMGHRQVAVLDGGLPAWRAAGYPVEAWQLHPASPGDFTANPQVESLITQSEMIDQLGKDERLILDARSAGRFEGTAPEPRPGLRSGHIPGSVSLPYGEVLREGRMRPVPELKEIFNRVNPGEKPMVFSCGSGMTACIILLAMEIAGDVPKALYDGSWAEWGMEDSGCPVA